MVNYEVANARVSGFSTFLGGVSLIALLLSINILNNRTRDPTLVVLGLETSTVVLLLAAMVLFFSSTVSLVSAYTEAERDLESSVRLARKFIGAGIVLTILGLGSLMLVAFGPTLQGYAYSVSAIGAAVAFVALRTRLGRPR